MASVDPHADPFAIFLAPPANETPAQRRTRKQAEEDARKESLRIDELLKADKALLKKRKNVVKVLLLGQSESGKTTTIKNFQLAYAHQAWLDERAAWRSIVYLNLIRSVITILDILATEMTSQELPNSLPSGRFSGRSEDSETDYLDDDTLVTPHRFNLTEKHKLLRLRLAPLRRIQEDLEAQINAGSADTNRLYSIPTALRSNPRRSNEFCIRSNCGWKGTVDRLRSQIALNAPHRNPQPPKTNRRKQPDINGVIAGCRSDIKSLWEDETVRAILKKRQIRLEDSSGFFLDDVDRIASRNYEPSDDDVIRARLRTVGVQEYRFIIEKGSEIGREWFMYDVGGSRTSRAAWPPFFDDINAIIFLAPISCFDETLEEDPSVNRMKDSLLLWKTICSSKLLFKVHLVLFLNKCDLLSKKLRRGGTKVQTYFPAFGNQSNDVKTVATYFQAEFKKIMKQSYPERHFFAHLTSVTNTKSTARTLIAVRDSILRSSLESATFI